MNNGTKIGFIHATIAGDFRYASKLEVFVDDGVAHVILFENAAVGGMDGTGEAAPFQETKRVTVPSKPGDIVKAVKKAIAFEQPSVIKRYGKPSKRFHWVGVPERGISAALVKRALEFMA